MEALGLTEPNDAGRRYAHGNMSAYTAGQPLPALPEPARETYRAVRREAGHDAPRSPRIRDTDDHLPRDWFRHQVWQPTCDLAGLDPRSRLHDLHTLPTADETALTALRRIRRPS